ncbi:MAG: YicC/YloC family endoribonuclease [Nitrospirota bacterium]
MTGYGRREAAWAGGSVIVELRAVNHRFCEVVARLPKSLVPLEDEFKREIQKHCQRGRIELTVSLGGGREGEKAPSLDQPLARQYYRLLRELQKELRLPGVIDVGLLAGFRDIVSVSDLPTRDRTLYRTAKRLLAGALKDLGAMRRREGEALARDLKGRLGSVRDLVALIEARAPAVVQEHFDRMKARVEKLIEPGQVDQGRLHQELALFADRCDVSEELARLGSHFAQFGSAIGSREPVGRTLDFLLQEMGREINTIGSKANDAEISSQVVRLKSEMEKLKEQVQNVE